MTVTPDSKPLLEVRGLQMHFPVTEGIVINRKVGEVKAVDGIDFTVRRGETLGLVGESGCGKTTTGRCILLLERPTAGEIIYDGVDLATLKHKELLAMRRRIQVIFQDPYSSLNPRMKVGDIIAEPIKVHAIEPDAARRGARVREALERVGLAKRATHRPSELSGGEQQRTAIARALVNRPTILFADEPTGNLDSATGESVMQLLKEIQLSMGMTIIMVTHERPLASRFADRIAALADGKLVSDGVAA